MRKLIFQDLTPLFLTMNLRLFTVLLFLFSAFASETLAQPEGSQPRAFSERDSVVAYSREFAKRFALPNPAPGMELTVPLQALEFRVEPSRYVPNTTECLLSAYIDSRVPLHFPTEGPSGSEALGFAQNHFFVHPNKGREHWLKLSLEDRRHFGSIQSRYNNNAVLATTNFSWSLEKGAFTTVLNRGFHRELFPGLAYVKLNLACPFPRWLGVQRPIHLWLKRLGGKDYSRIVRMDPADFEKFDIPVAFVEQMSALERSIRGSRSPSIAPQGESANPAAPEK